MSSRAITIAGFLAVGLAWVALELAARSRRTGIPTFSRWIDLIISYRYGRVGLLLIWLWLGWHFLAR